MAVLIEGISVVIRAEPLLRLFPGGWDAFQAFVPTLNLCADNELVRVGFRSNKDVVPFVAQLQSVGLEHLRDGAAIDMAVVDQTRGIAVPCNWLEYGHAEIDDKGTRIAVCSLVGSKVEGVFTPPDWKFKGSLSAMFGVEPKQPASKNGRSH
jgi:hypothetical protein